MSRSDDNIEIVRRFYDDWERGGSGPRELMADGIEYVNPAGAIEPGTRSGVAEFTRAIEKTREAWEVWHMQPDQFAAVDDKVAVVVHYRGRGRGSGAEIEGRESALWTIHDGKVASYEWFHEPTDAFDAIGLEQESA